MRDIWGRSSDGDDDAVGVTKSRQMSAFDLCSSEQNIATDAAIPRGSGWGET